MSPAESEPGAAQDPVVASWIDPIPAPAPEGPTRGRGIRWAVAAGGLTAMLGLGGYGVAAAAGGTSSTTTSTAPGGLPHGLPGLPGGGRGPAGEATVTAVGATTVTVSGPGGSSRTVSTDGATIYKRDGTTVDRSALAVGELVDIRVVRPAHSPSSSTTTTAAAVSPVAAELDIVSPRVEGTVVSVTGGAITLSDVQGLYRTVKTSPSTTYSQGGAAATASVVTVGARVVATGTVDADHTELDATSVTVGPSGPTAGGGHGGHRGFGGMPGGMTGMPGTTGTVASVSGGTITVTTPGGGTTTVDTTSSTTYRSPSGTGSLSSLAVGDRIIVMGSKAADGTVTATSIIAIPAGSTGAFGGPGGGGPNGPAGLRGRDGSEGGGGGITT